MNNWKNIAFITLVASALTLITTSCNKEGAADKAEPKKVASTQLIAEFETVKGKWLRPDGGYVIEIKELLADNQLTVGYFNPNPINIGESKIYKENSFIKVFVKMQDKNYPGSTYTLIYDKESDQLRGTYFQAVQGLEYQIGFTRMPK